jgi:hypothetical protein
MSFKKIIPALKVRQWLSGWDKAEFLRRSFFKFLEGRVFFLRRSVLRKV